MMEVVRRADCSRFPLCVSVRSPIGEVIGLRACYLEKLEPEQEITIGDETWVVIPWVRKLTMASGSDQPPASNAYGWAIRKS
ncbi:hypothetical protein [Stenotrophomonas lactitubi]|uniref:hypothetical protein n=1 Tax=Stenotrophomonas lactitubi TaxID=2045214 RepID=UPI00320986E2